MRRLTLMLCCCMSLSAMADTAIIPLRNSTPQDVIPAIQNLLEPGGTVNAYQGNLIIKSSAENISEIKKILDQIDKPARELLISVKQGGVGNETLQGYNVDANIDIGDNATLTTDGHTAIGTPDAAVKINDSKLSVSDKQHNFKNNVSQQVRAVEGYPAYILIGQQKPITQVYRNGNTVIENVEYQSANQGFYATAHILGNGQVQVEISTENDKFNRLDRNAINTQRANTQLSGRVGEWMSIGGIGQTETHQQSQLAGKSQSATQADNTIYIKVEILTQ